MQRGQVASMIKGVLLDLSGTVYVDNALIPGTLEAIEQLHAVRCPIRYITNSSRMTSKKILQRLELLGIRAEPEEIFTAPAAIKTYLHEHNLSPWFLVHPDIEEEFAGLGAASPDTVVVCDAAHAFTYEKLNQAFRILLEGAHLIAVGDNRYFREADGMSLDAGPFVRALEYAAECEAMIIGKPSAAFFRAAAAQLGCRAEEVLMVGDDVFSDINGALKAGLKAALVRTGKYRPGDEEKIIAPGACVCADLAEAVRGLSL